jgi:hypothetical protein
MTTNEECRRLLGKIKYLRSPQRVNMLATKDAIQHWHEESRSYAIELANELLQLNPELEERP